MKLLSLVILLALASCRPSNETDIQTDEELTPENSLTLRSSDSSTSSEQSREITLSAEHRSLITAHEQGPNELAAHIQEMMAQDEESTLQLLQHLELPINYDAIGYALFLYYSEQDRLADGLDAFKYLTDNPGIAAPTLNTFIMAYWEEDPTATLEWLTSHASYTGSEQAFHSVGIRIGGDSDPSARLDGVLAQDIPDDAKSNFLLGAIREWSMTDLESAFTYVSDLPPSTMIDRAIYHMAGQAADLDPAVAMAWAHALSDEGLRRSAIQTVGEIWQSNDPDSFAHWEATGEGK